MTRSAGPALHRLHDRFGDAVRFVSLYVREAHPGDRYPQPDTMDRKLAHARAYAERDDIDWTVAVDDVDGPLHQRMDPKPHAAYLVGSDGRVLWRTVWANDDRVVERALAAVATGRLPDPRQVEPLLVPMLAGTGEMWDTWEAAGGHAGSDVLREAPPVYLSGRIAGRLPFASPIRRGAVAMVLSAAPLVVAGLLVRAARRR